MASMVPVASNSLSNSSNDLKNLTEHNDKKRVKDGESFFLTNSIFSPFISKIFMYSVCKEFILKSDELFASKLQVDECNKKVIYQFLLF